MGQPLQSLSGMVDFECAARWGSFRLAAVELHKTPAAVSQQIKRLERSLGFALFVRHPRHVAITDKGRELAGALTSLLRELDRKIVALQGGGEESRLCVSTTHSFAMKWLVPRLHRFTEQNPAFDVVVDADDRPVDLDGGRCDVALRYARADGGALAYRESLVVVYSPALCPSKPGARPSLSALSRRPLLYEGTPEPWLRLLEANGVRADRYDFSRGYSHSGLLVQAAVAAQGVALAPYSLAYEDIARGNLRLCACEPLASAYGYRLLAGAGKADMPKVKRFFEWVARELAETAQSFTDATAPRRAPRLGAAPPCYRSDRKSGTISSTGASTRSRYASTGRPISSTFWPK